MVHSVSLKIRTQGNTDIVDITQDVEGALHSCEISSGTVTVFNVGSTAAITTIEYEPGLVNVDIDAALEKIAPAGGFYKHEETWHDDNGHAHVRASLIGPSLTVPFTDKKLILGTWQQIVLIDFDTRPRTRSVVCQVMGE